MSLSKNKKYIKDIIFAIGVLAIALFSFWRAGFGAGAYDDAFYLTIPYRMINGDVLFMNEWHGSQLSAFLLYPFVRIYLAIFASTDGIILSFRYLYIVVNAIATIAVYSRLRRFGGSSVAVLLYFLFVPYNILSLSYNSMGYMFILLSSVFMATNFNNNKAVYFASGLFFACAVLCQPVLVVFYILALTFACIYYCLKKKTEYIKFCGLFTVGCAVPALPVIIYFLSKMSIPEMLASIKIITTSDPEHNGNFAYSIYRVINSYNVDIFIYSFAVFIVLFVSALILKRMKKEIFLPVMLSSVFAVCFVYRTYYYFHSVFSFINLFYFPIALSGAIACVGIRDKQVKRLFVTSLIYSIAHSFSFISSNQFKFVMTPALMPVYISSVIVCWKLLMENAGTDFQKKMSKAYTAVMAMALSVVVFFTVFCRYESIFSSSGRRTINEMTDRISCGCYSGILSSEDVYNEIENYKADFDRYGFSENDKVLILSARTWLSLENKGRLAQYSAWLSGIGENTVDRLKEYYKLNPENKPKYVYICKDEAKENSYDVVKWAQENNCKLDESEIAYLICL